jgi:hypothetical protein
LRNGTPKSSLFSNHLFTESQQTDSFEIGKIYENFFWPQGGKEPLLDVNWAKPLQKAAFATESMRLDT